MADLLGLVKNAGAQTPSPTVGGAGGDRTKAYKRLTSPAVAGAPQADEMSTDEAAVIGAKIKNPGVKSWSARLWTGAASALALICHETVAVTTNVAGVCTAWGRTLTDHFGNIIKVLGVFAHYTAEELMDPDGDYHGVQTKFTAGPIAGTWRIKGGPTVGTLVDYNTTATAASGRPAFLRMGAVSTAADMVDAVGDSDGTGLTVTYGDGSHEVGQGVQGGGQRTFVSVLAGTGGADALWIAPADMADNSMAVVEVDTLVINETADVIGSWEHRAEFFKDGAAAAAQWGFTEELYMNPLTPGWWSVVVTLAGNKPGVAVQSALHARVKVVVRYIRNAIP